MHKRPEDGLWLQIRNSHLRNASLAQGKRCKQASKKLQAKLIGQDAELRLNM